MKKIIFAFSAMLFICALCFSLCACDVVFPNNSILFPNNDNNMSNGNSGIDNGSVNFDEVRSQVVTEQGWKDAFTASENVTIKFNVVAVDTDETFIEQVFYFDHNSFASTTYQVRENSSVYEYNYLILNDDETLTETYYYKHTYKNEDGTTITIADDTVNYIYDKDDSEYNDVLNFLYRNTSCIFTLSEIFVDNFEKFTYDANKGAYVCAKLIVEYEGYARPRSFENLVVKIVDGKLIYLSETETSEDEYVKTVVITCYNYGNTTVPVLDYTEISWEE